MSPLNPFVWLGFAHLLHPAVHRPPPHSITRVTTSARNTTTTSTMTSFQPQTQYDFDLVVIGGGSGGMSCSKAAASLGANVALFDYVKPSTQGTTWGLGGTCVNVGCVPKKLCHYAGLLGHGIHDAKAVGWNVEKGSHDWSKLTETVGNHVRMLNFRYRTGLRSKKVNYINGLAKFVDPHTIEYTEKSNPNEPKRVTAAKIVIAVGGRPNIPSEVPGAVEHAITSDDLFFLQRSPGKTLCVGGSYIALECAGFLTELDYDVTVAVRSILLRGFDRQCAEKIGSLMEDIGTNIMTGFQPSQINKLPNGKLQVVFSDVNNQGIEKGEQYDTVFYATGRNPDLAGLNLPAAGVNVATSGKLVVTNEEQTNVPHIYAVGDVCEGKQELTPVAVRAGELLANRLFGSSTVKMDYNNIATTVFTPFEYGTTGLSEEEAIEKYGENDVEVYLFEFTTLELSAMHREKHYHPMTIPKKYTPEELRTNPNCGQEEDMGNTCMSKLVCIKSQDERVVGFHFIGPNAGEITQGFSLAVKLGAKKADFDGMVGIHPTDAESFSSLTITRRSGKVWGAEGGCGGGVCG